MEFLKNVIVWGFYKASIMPDFLKQTKKPSYNQGLAKIRTIKKRCKSFVTQRERE